MNDKEKIKNAVRIIDGKIVSFKEMKREMEKRTYPFEFISTTILITALDLVKMELHLLQKIRDELIPEEKS